MGQAHSRSMAAVSRHFDDREYDVTWWLCADNVAARRDQAVASFGFEQATEDWRSLVDNPADRRRRVYRAEHVAPSRHRGRCRCRQTHPVREARRWHPEPRPHGRTRRAQSGARSPGSGTTTDGHRSCSTRSQLIADGILGEITNYRGRFFSMYGADPMGLLSWRFLVDEGGYGVTTDILSHSVDLAHFLLGSTVNRLTATVHTYITERPLPGAGGTHYDRGRPGDPTGAVTNEDYVAMLCTFTNGVQGVFESSRAIIGPESQNAFEVYGTKGSVAWNLETMNELRVYVTRDDELHTGYTTVYGGDRFPHHGNFVPGSANSIGFEDLVVIEDHEYLQSVATGRRHAPGFEEALAFVSVQDAVLRSAASGHMARRPVAPDRGVEAWTRFDSPPPAPSCDGWLPSAPQSTASTRRSFQACSASSGTAT